MNNAEFNLKMFDMVVEEVCHSYGMSVDYVFTKEELDKMSSQYKLATYRSLPVLVGATITECQNACQLLDYCETGV